ncbi:MAG: ImmA/IrrE family metallo-endopeptidase [Anaerorhabdus sp.]|uniref:ImmA/IrrE family metallo-endopeptidase n=1 Tax=Anaerorhabdus sp. TaxID=1872524 RepID=UPI003A841DB6
MNYLLKYADDNNYSVFFNKTNITKSLSVEINNALCINVDESKIENEAEKRVCLAHELGHCISGTLYTINHSNLYRGSAEYRADYRAAKLVIPINQLKECIVNGITEKYEIAEYFNITEEFVERVYYIYKNKGLI